MFDTFDLNVFQLSRLCIDKKANCDKSSCFFFFIFSDLMAPTGEISATNLYNFSGWQYIFNYFSNSYHIWRKNLPKWRWTTVQNLKTLYLLSEMTKKKQQIVTFEELEPENVWLNRFVFLCH